MPLINGMKMACEPCIRGHRSTKCTHANERLMVPVRKPGRPLSACPHPQDQPCGCSSVTAAIPRKQACHCAADPTSPSKITFKIDKKAGRPSSSRKPSYDRGGGLERMDPNMINIQGPQGIPVTYSNGYAVAAAAPQMMGFAPPYPQHHYSIPIQSPPQAIYGGTNGYMNGGVHNGLEQVMESPLTTPVPFNSRDSGKFTNGSSYMEAAEAVTEVRVTNGGSCCAPKQNGNRTNGHSQTSGTSSIPEPRELAPKVSSCCSSKSRPKLEPVSTQSTPQIAHQMLPHNGIHFQPTVFTYPATYGSFQNPLHPTAWRQSVQANNYSQAPFPPGQLPFDTPLGPGLDTVHTCGCGDTCQCVGCAAHPYNDATQDYVRSAYTLSMEHVNKEPYTNGHHQSQNNGSTNGNGSVNGNGLSTTQPPADLVSSPTAHTPSSTTSANGEEQSYSAADFFFVSYPFSGDGCGGDTQSCPCGDDCECLGCTIHRQPPIPCIGDDTGCPCGDDCQCIGCEIHKNSAPPPVPAAADASEVPLPET